MQDQPRPDADMPENPGRDDEAPGPRIPWEKLTELPDNQEDQQLGWTSGACW